MNLSSKIHDVGEEKAEAFVSTKPKSHPKMAALSAGMYSSSSGSPKAANSSKVAAFVDRRTVAMKKCFISDEKTDGKEIFQEFLQNKYKQNSNKAIDEDLGKQVDCGIIDGAHTYKICWDMFVGLLIIYSAVVVPYRLGFAIDSQGEWLFVDYIVDAIFLIDMVLSFNTSFNNGGKEVIRTRKEIARNYLKTWFVPDFISTFPFDTIVFLTVKSFSAGHLRTFKLVRVLRLFRLLKIFRIIRLNRKLQNAKAGGHINVFVYDLLMVMTSVFFMAHFFSCIFYQFLDCVPDDNNFTACGNKSAYSQYLLSLSWSLQTILTIGYGNVVLTSLGGRIFSIFAMIGGAIIFGFVMAVMMQAASNKTPSKEEEQKNLAIVGAYLNERCVSHKIKLTIWRHCRYYYSKKALFDEPVIFQTAPAALRRRFFDAMRSNINKLRILERNFTTLSRIQKHLHPLLVEPGDSIVHQGDYCTDLFFVQKGQVHAFVHSARTQHRQTFVGEFCEGYDFGMSNALRVKDKCWATYRANETSDMLWIDITRLDLDDDIVQEFEMHAMHELELQDQIEEFFSDITVIDTEAKLYATPSVIYKREIVLLADINGTVTDYKELKNDGVSHKTSKLFRVLRPVKGDPKRHEIVMESSEEMSKRYIINPDSKYKSYFDGYIALCTVLVIFILPLRMGFSIELNTAWNVYDIIIEVSFIFDVILSFFTAYEMSDMVLNTDKHHITARYLKGWFIVDMLAGLPVSMLTLNEGFLLLKLFKFARIMRLVRVMRVFKVARLFKVLKLSYSYEENPFSTSKEETYVKFARLSFIVLIFTHITACFWGKLANDKSGTDTWEDAAGIEDSSLWTRYLASFYFIYVTMNTTGYGDILAQNDLERFFLLFIFVLGAFLVAHVVAEISETNTGTECNTERIFLLRSYLANKQIPETVQQAMLKQVTFANKMRTSFSEIEIWQTLPFQTRVELSVVCHSAIISQFPDVFDTKSPPIIFYLLNYFEPVYIIQGGYAFTFETGSGGIYLVSSGVVEVVDEDEVGNEVLLGEHRDGGVFGTECITNEKLTFVGVRAKENTSCYRFASSCIPVLHKEHPSISRDFFKSIKSLYKDTVRDAVVPTFKRHPMSIEENSRSFSGLSEHGVRTCIQYCTSVLRSMVMPSEDDVLDVNTVYNRANIDSGKWTPAFRNRLESYFELNSPSLILSNESWKLFVTMKDSLKEQRGVEKEEERCGADYTEDIIAIKSTPSSDAIIVCSTEGK
jgi:CRP-like cAMP-binding protein